MPQTGRSPCLRQYTYFSLTGTFSSQDLKGPLQMVCIHVVKIAMHKSLIHGRRTRVCRGGTPHFDYVAGECVKGMAQVTLKHGVPVAFGVLTVDTIEQAIERAGTKAGNKGWSAAMAAVEMANLVDAIDRI